MDQNYFKSQKKWGWRSGWPSCDGCLLPTTRRGPGLEPASNISWLLFTNIHPAPPLYPLPLPASKYKKSHCKAILTHTLHWILFTNKFYSAKISPGTYWKSRLDGIIRGALNYFLDIKSILTDISMIQNHYTAVWNTGSKLSKIHH